MKPMILLVGFNNEKAGKINAAFAEKGWETITAVSDEDAVERFHQLPVSAVVFGKEMEAPAVKRLSGIFGFQDKEIVLMREEDSLAAAVAGRLFQKEQAARPEVTIIDDALVNAGLRINLQ